MSISEFEQTLKEHDWFFEMADDYRAYSRGQSEREKILSIAREKGVDFQRAFNTVFARHYPKAPSPFPNLPNPAEEKPKQQTNTHRTHMKKNWQDITLGELAAALVAAVLGSSNQDQATPLAETTVETPSKPTGGRGKKAAAPVEEEPEEPRVTMDDIKTAAAKKIKAIPDNRAKIKGFIEKLGAPELAKVKPEDFERLLKAINKLPEDEEEGGDGL